MRSNKVSIITSYTLAAMARGGLNLPHINEERMSRPRRERPLSKRMPHQSTRECARRIGGERWRFVKMADRARRGLPPRVAFFDFETRKGGFFGGLVMTHNIPRADIEVAE